MTAKGAVLSLLLSAGWIASVALAAPPAGEVSRFACPQGAPPSCAVAQANLAEAQSAVEAAAARNSLWTTAAEALREGQRAFFQGDYAAAQRAAGIAIQQARLGIAQSAYPTFPFPSH